MSAFLDRPIEGEWRYLWIDATYVKVREAGRIVSVAVIASSACPPWQIDPKPARTVIVVARQKLHHTVGHDLWMRDRQILRHARSP